VCVCVCVCVTSEHILKAYPIHTFATVYRELTHTMHLYFNNPVTEKILLKPIQVCQPHTHTHTHTQSETFHSLHSILIIITPSLFVRVVFFVCGVSVCVCVCVCVCVYAFLNVCVCAVCVCAMCV